ncbi:DUF362 domain-containing protein [Desulfofundulus thermosubterraneus]|uniref:4Fe-4S ferredoxin-type domain-containing protein n=1 Tax=Desulfofundulus thermosubterraneus DSM 16057 TaxID=1121432 RepID=A0A1M6EB26_9FIRM|nr:DUF362 domain-containing protein [Desulfofundulus thermosubterraneus]SHI82530.1 hypothetical protein SAMN02745219_01169 [Desulfofundulus thermosubterraneus DSM 16057]
MSNVYLVSARARNIRDNLLAKIERIMQVPEIAALVPTGRKATFIKTSYSRVGYNRHLRPIVLRTIVEKIKEFGGTPVVTDTSAFFPKGHFAGDQWFTSAELMGYSEIALGCERILANGYEGDDGEFISTGGTELGGVEVARAIREAECLLVVSHIAGHPFAGFTGALYNLGVECLNNSGKSRVYEGIRPVWLAERCELCGTCVQYCQWQALQISSGRLHVDRQRCAGCGNCVVICANRAHQPVPEQVVSFQRKVAEASSAIVRTLKKKAVYINILYDIVPQPDKISWADIPFVPDIGIVASTDPVAVDAATHDLITKSPGIPKSAAEDFGVLEPGREKITSITGANPAVLYCHAGRLGVGFTRYQLFK